MTRHTIKHFKYMEFFHFSRHFMGIICFNFIATPHVGRQMTLAAVTAKCQHHPFCIRGFPATRTIMFHSTLAFFLAFILKSVDFHSTHTPRNISNDFKSFLSLLLPNMRCSINSTGDKQQKRTRRRRSCRGSFVQQVCLIQLARSEFM